MATTSKDMLSPRIVSHPALEVAGIVAHYDEGGSAGIPEQWRRFIGAMETLPARTTAATYGIVFSEPKPAKGFSYLTGVEVEHTKSLPSAFKTITIPAHTYAVFAHPGHVTQILQTCARIWRDWLPGSGHGAVGGALDFFERYGEGFDPATGTGDIEIWLPIIA